MAVKLLASLSVAALSAGWLAQRSAQQRSEQAEKTYPPEGELINVNGRTVHVVVEGQGPDVILLHGAGGNTREFTFDLMQRLAPTYRVIAMDRPGHGYTDRTHDRYDSAFTDEAESPAEQAALLFAAAETLGVSKPILVGHSYGGTVALAWALDFPDAVAGVVTLGSPTHPWEGNLGAYYRVNGSALGGALVPPLIAALAGEAKIESSITALFAPNPVPEGYREHIGALLTIRPESFRANTKQVNTLWPHIAKMADRYADDLRVPLEIIHGEEDATVPFDIHVPPMMTDVPHASVTRLSGVGHMPHHTHPEEVEAAIARIAATLR